MAYVIVTKALKKMGQDIDIARRKRKISMEDLAQRAGISRTTLSRLLKGDDGVAIGSLAGVLNVLGELEKIMNVIDVSLDDTGMLLDKERLPKRVLSEKSKAKQKKSDKIDPKGIAF
ncbi:helix-turn-helix domain-containing protein [Pseudovibrio ascidiaceicola]|uniref:helix-turn-helix domain-containing protein n=1 Tax=Pseudovibrio ascidiaceicola TaxID=285279 RepID=UPI003D36EF69